MLRKIHLGKALEQDNWDVIRLDLHQLPIEGIDGDASTEAILDILGQYGVRQSDQGVQVEIWGSGKPMREFLWSQDMADACVFVMQHIDFKDLAGEKKEVRSTHLNIGTGQDISIKDLAQLIKKQLDFQGEFFFREDKPDGTMKKLTDVTKLKNLGWEHSISLETGIEKMYAWYNQQA